MAGVRVRGWEDSITPPLARGLSYLATRGVIRPANGGEGPRGNYLMCAAKVRDGSRGSSPLWDLG